MPRPSMLPKIALHFQALVLDDNRANAELGLDLEGIVSMSILNCPIHIWRESRLLSLQWRGSGANESLRCDG